MAKAKPCQAKALPQKEAGRIQEKVRVVLVEPEYALNVGATCRVMKNFGFSELCLVNPECELGMTATMHAKHAKEVLAGVNICSSLAEATRGCTFAIGTTGILKRYKGTVRNPLRLREFLKKLAKQKPKGKIALVFGREGTGLTQEEIRQCDFLVSIEASLEYPVLNLSHAVAVVLYELSDFRPITIEKAGEGEKEALLKTFDGLVERQAGLLRNKEKVKTAFRRVVGRSLIAGQEAKAILGVLKLTVEELESGRKKNWWKE